MIKVFIFICFSVSSYLRYILHDILRINESSDLNQIYRNLSASKWEVESLSSFIYNPSDVVYFLLYHLSGFVNEHVNGLLLVSLVILWFYFRFFFQFVRATYANIFSFFLIANSSFVSIFQLAQFRSAIACTMLLALFSYRHKLKSVLTGLFVSYIHLAFVPILINLALIRLLNIKNKIYIVVALILTSVLFLIFQYTYMHQNLETYIGYSNFFLLAAFTVFFILFVFSLHNYQPLMYAISIYSFLALISVIVLGLPNTRYFIFLLYVSPFILTSQTSVSRSYLYMIFAFAVFVFSWGKFLLL